MLWGGGKKTLDIFWADHESFTKQQDNNSESTNKLIEKFEI